MVESRTAYDVVVIGGGPGGYTAAIRASQMGMKAALIEAEGALGGVCLNWGCIPTKALLKQAEVLRLLQRVDELGFTTGEVSYDWGKVVARSRTVAAEMAGGVDYLVKKNGIDLYRGRARLTPVRDVEVAKAGEDANVTLETRNILVASGGSPRSLPGVEIDGKRVLSSRHAMTLARCPASMVIVGGGAIGLEFAYFFNAFGTEVTVLEAEPNILPREDEEIATLLRRSLESQGVTILTGVRIGDVSGGKRRHVTVSFEAVDGESGSRQVRAERLLMAVGVRGNTEGMGHEAAGVRVSGDGIDVNERMETNVSGIYAAGDVVGAPQLAHAATAEGIAAVENMAGRARPPIDADAIPSCIYCQPQVASVGLSEARAREAGHDVRVGRFPFRASGKAAATGETEGLVKLVFEARYGELLGGCVIGSEATELIAEIALARQMEATYEELANTVHAHPTLSEAVMEAAGEAFGEAVNI